MNAMLTRHDSILNRYCFNGTLSLETSLRVSSGRASDTSDAAFIRNFNEIPYIPGSSLRGAIRSEIERILNAVGDSTGITHCILFEKDSCDKTIRKALKEMEMEGAKIDDQKIREVAGQKLCAVCRLFGSTYYASRLIIEDALPPSDEIEKAKNGIRIRDGVGIDRDTGAAKDGAKFDYEVIESGDDCPTFIFKMVAENVSSDIDTKLINLVLKILKSGLYVGGKRAAGLGRIRLASDYEVSGFTSPQELWETFQGKSAESKIVWEEVV